MKTDKSKLHWTNKLAIIFSFCACLILCINIFIGNEKLRFVMWAMCILSLTMNFLAISYQEDKWLRYSQLYLYECQLLRRSYIDMVKYIDKLEIPELNDLFSRVENEFEDIEIKKINFAEQNNFPKKEIEEMKNEN